MVRNGFRPSAVLASTPCHIWDPRTSDISENLVGFMGVALLGREHLLCGPDIFRFL